MSSPNRQRKRYRDPVKHRNDMKESRKSLSLLTDKLRKILITAGFERSMVQSRRQIDEACCLLLEEFNEEFKKAITERYSTKASPKLHSRGKNRDSGVSLPCQTTGATQSRSVDDGQASISSVNNNKNSNSQQIVHGDSSPNSISEENPGSSPVPGSQYISDVQTVNTCSPSALNLSVTSTPSAYQHGSLTHINTSPTREGPIILTPGQPISIDNGISAGLGPHNYRNQAANSHSPPASRPPVASTPSADQHGSSTPINTSLTREVPIVLTPGQPISLDNGVSAGLGPYNYRNQATNSHSPPASWSPVASTPSADQHGSSTPINTSLTRELPIVLTPGRPTSLDNGVSAGLGPHNYRNQATNSHSPPASRQPVASTPSADQHGSSTPINTSLTGEVPIVLTQGQPISIDNGISAGLGLHNYRNQAANSHSPPASRPPVASTPSADQHGSSTPINTSLTREVPIVLTPGQPTSLDNGVSAGLGPHNYRNQAANSHSPPASRSPVASTPSADQHGFSTPINTSLTREVAIVLTPGQPISLDNGISAGLGPYHYRNQTANSHSPPASRPPVTSTPSADHHGSLTHINTIPSSEGPIILTPGQPISFDNGISAGLGPYNYRNQIANSLSLVTGMPAAAQHGSSTHVSTHPAHPTPVQPNFLDNGVSAEPGTCPYQRQSLEQVGDAVLHTKSGSFAAGSLHTAGMTPNHLLPPISILMPNNYCLEQHHCSIASLGQPCQYNEHHCPAPIQPTVSKEVEPTGTGSDPEPSNNSLQCHTPQDNTTTTSNMSPSFSSHTKLSPSQTIYGQTTPACHRAREGPIVPVSNHPSQLPSNNHSVMCTPGIRDDVTAALRLTKVKENPARPNLVFKWSVSDKQGMGTALLGHGIEWEQLSVLLPTSGAFCGHSERSYIDKTPQMLKLALISEKQLQEKEEMLPVYAATKLATDQSSAADETDSPAIPPSYMDDHAGFSGERIAAESAHPGPFKDKNAVGSMSGKATPFCANSCCYLDGLPIQHAQELKQIRWKATPTQCDANISKYCADARSAPSNCNGMTNTTSSRSPGDFNNETSAARPQFVPSGRFASNPNADISSSFPSARTTPPAYGCQPVQHDCECVTVTSSAGATHQAENDTRINVMLSSAADGTAIDRCEKSSSDKSHNNNTSSSTYNDHNNGMNNNRNRTAQNDDRNVNTQSFEVLQPAAICRADRDRRSLETPSGLEALAFVNVLPSSATITNGIGFPHGEQGGDIGANRSTIAISDVITGAAEAPFPPSTVQPRIDAAVEGFKSNATAVLSQPAAVLQKRIMENDPCKKCHSCLLTNDQANKDDSNLNDRVQLDRAGCASDGDGNRECNAFMLL